MRESKSKLGLSTELVNKLFPRWNGRFDQLMKEHELDERLGRGDVPGLWRSDMAGYDCCVVGEFYAIAGHPIHDNELECEVCYTAGMDFWHVLTGYEPLKNWVKYRDRFITHIKQNHADFLKQVIVK